jgi:hypothetical protein
MLLRSDNKAKVSMKLMASLAPVRAEVEAGVVAKADQFLLFECDFLCKSQKKTCAI